MMFFYMSDIETNADYICKILIATVQPRWVY